MVDQPFTRRRLIRGAAQAASFAAASVLMPPNLQRLLAATPKAAGSIKDVKHIVLLMQENRSFDHYFGTLAGVRGFGDAKAQMLATGRNVFHQPDDKHPDGHLLPFHLDTAASNAQKLPSTSHAWKVQHQAWNGGKMDQWLPAHRMADGENGPYVMGYFKREDIPFHYALADAFTICDHYHCSVMGPAQPALLAFRHDRSRRRAWRARDLQQAARRRRLLPLEDLCRTAGGSRRALGHLPVWREGQA